MADPFARDPESIQQNLVMACSRRTAALANLDRALAAIEAADNEVLTFTRHVSMCDRQIDSLLDELGRTKTSA